VLDRPSVDREPLRPSSTKKNLAEPSVSFSASLRSLDLDTTSLNAMYCGDGITAFGLRPNNLVNRWDILQYVKIYCNVSRMKNQPQLILKVWRNFFPKVGQVM
jgi:hypothetical protein